MTMKNRHLQMLPLIVFRSALALLLMAVLTTPASAVTNGNPIVVSMGDSYSAGEGTPPFYGQDGSDKYHDEDWLAHRSKKAWAGQLVVQGTTLNTIWKNGWYFTAVSGAECRHITRDTYRKDYQKDIFDTGSVDLPVQGNVLNDNSLTGMVDYVTMTIGGNDLGFVDVVKAAVLDTDGVRLGGLESTLKDGIYKFETQTKSDLLSTYEYVMKGAGPQATVIIAGYPHLTPSSGRGGWCSADEAKLMNAAVDTFDTEVRNLINNTGRSNLVFVDVRGEFAGREAQYINDVIFGTMDQDLKIIDITSAYSVHPNEYGQQAYARAVQAVIDRLEKNAQQPTDPSGTKPAIALSSDASMMLVFDVSGSMDDSSAMSGMTKLDSAKKQSTDFVSSVSGQGGAGGVSVRVGVASFATNSETNCTLSNDPATINDSIQGLYAHGRTNIYAGLSEGINQLAGESGPKLMVFLSDGQSNEGGSESDILTLAEEAHKEGIVIYTIGFGDSGDLDENLLRQIAEITGGSYSHEDSSDISAAAVGLFATMMGAQLQATTSQVLIESTGTVQQDGTTQVGTFDVTTNGDLVTYLYWPGSILDMQLTDPDGVVVGEGYQGYTIDNSTIPSSITITNAKKGTWHMSVFGREVSMAAEPFYAVAALNEIAEEIVAPISTGGGGATNSGGGMLFLLIAVAVACLSGVFAMSVRRK